MARPLMSLSLKGTIHDPQQKADRLMSYYFTTNRSQSNIFRRHMISLPYQIQSRSGDIRAIQKSVESELQTYLSHYFDSVSAHVRSDIPNREDPGRYNLIVDVILMQDGVSYSLGRLLEVDGSIIKAIIKVNNEGTLF